METKATYLLRKSVPAKKKKYKKVAVIDTKHWKTSTSYEPTLDALTLSNISGKTMCKPEVGQKFFKEDSGKWILRIQES